MRKIIYFTFLMSWLFFQIVGCGSESSGSDAQENSIDVATGFSQANLKNKTFFVLYYVIDDTYFRSYTFSEPDILVEEEDSFYALDWDGTTYSIVNSNGINGVLVFNFDNEVYYNIHSVEHDHIKLCVTDNGIDAVVACEIDHTVNWYYENPIVEDDDT